MAEKAKSVAGRTFRWTFNEGPTAGKTYEHTFNPDGTVVYREASGAAKGKSEGGKSAPEKKAPPTRYAAFEVAPETHMVSYLAGSGFTLTVAMNLQTKKCYGVASNEKQWFPVTGTLEAVK